MNKTCVILLPLFVFLLIGVSSFVYAEPANRNSNTITPLESPADKLGNTFNTTWKVNNPESPIYIPVVTKGTYTVDWGDGTVPQTILANTAYHFYDKPGAYQVKMSGDVSHIYFQGPAKSFASDLQSVDQWGDIKWTSMKFMFWGAVNMKYLATDAPDLSQVTDMEGMFVETTLFNADLRNWDVSNVTNMKGAFASTHSFTGNLINWDVSNVTDMSWMFVDSSNFNGDLSYWDVSNVTDMKGMFTSATSFNGDLNKWDVSNVTDMNTMFAKADSFDRDLSNWNTSKVTNMELMFAQSPSFNQDISSWDVSNVTDMTLMFNGTTSFSTSNYDKLLVSFSNQDVKKDVTLDADSSFCRSGENARSFLIDEHGWKINDKYLDTDENCKNDSTKSGDTPEKTPDNKIVSTYDTTWKIPRDNYDLVIPVTTDGTYYVTWGDNTYTETITAKQAAHTYDKAGTYKILMSGDVSHIDFVGDVKSFASNLQSVDQWGNIKWTSMENMFWEAENMKLLATDVPDLSRVTSTASMFFGANSFNGDISDWDVSNVTEMDSMFRATPFNGDLSNWDVSNVIDMRSMFSWNFVFNQDLSNWDVSNVTDMSYMFMTAKSFSTTNYDKLLVSISNQKVQTGVVLDSYSKYCISGEASRVILILDYGWKINDRGPDTDENCKNDPTKSGDTPEKIPDNKIITTYDTTWKIPFDDYQIYIPVTTDGTYTVDWGDDTDIQTITAQPAAHTYDKTGTYKISMSGDVSHIYYDYTSQPIAKFQSVDNWGDIKWTSMKNMFFGAENMKLLATDTPDLSKVTDMESMFAKAASFNGDLNNWDVSNVTNMVGMFAYANSFNGTLSDWDVSNVTDMDHMFAYANSFNADISDWDVTMVNNMAHMFASATSFNGDLNNWDVSNVYNMNSMFLNTPFNQDLSSWDTGNAIDMRWMFLEARSFNQDLSNWDVTYVGNMIDMFKNAPSFSTSNYDKLLVSFSNQDVENDVYFVSDSKYCKSGESARNILVNDFGWRITDNGMDTNENCILNNYESFETTWEIPFDGYVLIIPVRTEGTYLVDWGDDSGIETITAQEAVHVYDEYGTYQVKMSGDISHIEFTNSKDDSRRMTSVDQWGDIKWTSMKHMFYGAENMKLLATDVPDLSRVTSTATMFGGATLFNSNLGNWDVSNVTDMSWMFNEATSFNGDIGSWNTGNVVAMYNMFASATSFNGDVKRWDTSNVTDMKGMFASATLFDGNVSNWDTSKVTNTRHMFNGATSFNHDISDWDISKVITMQSMLENATSFSTINYDKLLSSFSNQDVKRDVMFDSASQYCIGEEAARNILINDYNWSITDKGIDTSGICNAYPVTKNLIKNGSFEVPIVEAGWELFSMDSTSFSWDIQWNSNNPHLTESSTACPHEPTIELQRNLMTNALEGNQYAELDTHCYSGKHPSNYYSSVVISQEVSIIESEIYELSWYSKGRVGTSSDTNALEILIDNVPMKTISPMSEDWEKTSILFTTNMDTVLISFADVGIPNTYGTFLDNVVLKRMP